MSPTRIQRRRTKGWTMPDGAIYVGRPSKWGNPFQPVHQSGTGTWMVFDEDVIDYPGFGEYRSRVASLWACKRLYAELHIGHAVTAAFTYEQVRAELAGRDLACWCPIGAPCHGDFLLAIANRED